MGTYLTIAAFLLHGDIFAISSFAITWGIFGNCRFSITWGYIWQLPFVLLHRAVFHNFPLFYPVAQPRSVRHRASLDACDTVSVFVSVLRPEFVSKIVPNIPKNAPKMDPKPQHWIPNRSQWAKHGYKMAKLGPKLPRRGSETDSGTKREVHGAKH